VTSIAFEDWQGGKLRVNRDFAQILRTNQLDTFDALMNYTGGTIAKNLLVERTTTRITLQDGERSRGFYIKRHSPSPLKEYIKPLLRLTWPILGARNEWNALFEFHAAGIPTMTPVALGEVGRYSFLVTEAIDGYTKLPAWLEQQPPTADLSPVVNRVAEIARRMHAAGLHHQDFYLGHLLIHHCGDDFDVRVIDLGRARASAKLSKRWIIKDLAQLDYSSRHMRIREQVRFLHGYFGGSRRLDPAEKRLVRRIRTKSRWIARHSQKNRL
jgi:tRNA A-37 threonylcarbamoyl transferase component Bud32